MTDTEWDRCWQLIKSRWSEWAPSAQDHSDFKLSLQGETELVVQQITLTVRQEYASRNPSLAWFMKARQRVQASQNSERAQRLDETRSMSDDEYRYLETERAIMLADMQANPKAMAAAANRLEGKARHNDFLASTLCKPELAIGLIWVEMDRVRGGAK